MADAIAFREVVGLDSFIKVPQAGEQVNKIFACVHRRAESGQMDATALP